MQFLPIIAIVVVLIIIISYFFTIYNGLILVKNNLKKSWSNIDVLLMQRSDEIPKLLTTIKAFVKHEKNMIDKDIDKMKSDIDNYIGSSAMKGSGFFGF